MTTSAAEALVRLGAPLSRCAHCARVFRPKTRTWMVHCRMVVTDDATMEGGTINTTGQPCCGQACADARREQLRHSPPENWPATEGGATCDPVVIRHRTDARWPHGPSGILVLGGYLTMRGGSTVGRL